MLFIRLYRWVKYARQLVAFTARVHLFARAISSAVLTRSDAIREPRHLAGRFLLELTNKTGKRLCPTGVVKPVPSTRNEHSLLFTVQPASRAPPDDVPINIRGCVYTLDTDLSYPANTDLSIFIWPSNVCCFETLHAERCNADTIYVSPFIRTLGKRTLHTTEVHVVVVY